MAERKLKIPKGGIPYECEQNDNTIIVFKSNKDVIDELYFGNRSMPQEGWTVIGYEDLINAIAKANTNGGT